MGGLSNYNKYANYHVDHLTDWRTDNVHAGMQTGMQARTTRRQTQKKLSTGGREVLTAMETKKWLFFSHACEKYKDKQKLQIKVSSSKCGNRLNTPCGGSREHYPQRGRNNEIN